MSKIFEHLDQKDCGAAAIVCRRWSSSALDELWRSLPTLIPLLSLLGPIEDTNMGKDLQPDVIVAEGTWEVFKGYAKRVRVLAHDSGDALISTGLVLRIVSAHLGQTVLPNLREADWNLCDDDTTYQVAVFCSPSLDSISLQIANDGVDIRMVQRMLVSLSSFPLPRLRVIHITTEYPRGTDAQLNEALSAFIKNRGTLSELRLQAVQVTPDGGLLAAACGFSQLRVLEGDLVGYTGTSFRSALEDLASACPLLETVSFGKGGLNTGDNGETLTFDDVEPLLRCRRLEDVRIWGDTLQPFEEEDIGRIGCAWPRLTTLVIGSRAEPAQDTGAPILRLMDYAWHLPTLRRLACRFDCSERIPSAGQVIARFKHLRILGLEESIIPSGRLTFVAEFLSMVCGPAVKFTSSVNSWFSDRAFEDRDGWAEPDEWNQVETMIQAIHRVQIGYSRLMSDSAVA
ncbi:hypothetical protein M407DRAFT_23968 [Tulasnella calospora MUT 4182]|uniref:F-box domain-containing protein n=1 Tax=Tulasnella calospora MUT 4182 TaxID=1051891 RepID=A0A0C3KZF6_9AGAM|nr:hypothetical protein M407DRAFT_23968 [Tulasnella calospora MUT 4182]